MKNLPNRVTRDFFLLFSPRCSHRLMEKSLVWLDNHPKCLDLVNRLGVKRQAEAPVKVGSLSLNSPLILGAGLVKGRGFASEADALRAVNERRNIMPGWRSIPNIVGPAEFGSFTPRPRMGNSEPILWRDRPAMTLYNRVGLRNPGIVAAANFLGARASQLPSVWGVSLAPDPEEANQQKRLEGLANSARILVDCGLAPSWVTVNLSCPNAEPEGGQRLPDTQSPDEARQLCLAVRNELPADVVVWAKVGPDHSEAFYFDLAHALAQAGVEAVIATNTISRKPPDLKTSAVKTRRDAPASKDLSAEMGGAKGVPVDALDSPAGSGELTAGMSGARLGPYALQAVKALSAASKNLPLEVIGCGGVMDGQTFLDFKTAGAVAVQYWSALVFRGPLAADIIMSEAQSVSAKLNS